MRDLSKVILLPFTISIIVNCNIATVTVVVFQFTGILPVLLLIATCTALSILVFYRSIVHHLKTLASETQGENRSFHPMFVRLVRTAQDQTASKYITVTGTVSEIIEKSTLSLASTV